MARYTGAQYKKSRHLGFSTLEMVRNLQKDLMLLVFMDKIEEEN